MVYCFMCQAYVLPFYVKISLCWNIYVQCMCVYSLVSNSLWPKGLKPTRLLSPWDVLGNTGVGCHFLFSSNLNWDFLPNPGNPTCISCIDRWILYHWVHLESLWNALKMVTWPKIPFRFLYNILWKNLNEYVDQHIKNSNTGIKFGLIIFGLFPSITSFFHVFKLKIGT